MYIYSGVDLSGPGNDATVYYYLRDFDRKNMVKINKFPRTLLALRTRCTLMDWLIHMLHMGHFEHVETLFCAARIVDMMLTATNAIHNIEHAPSIIEITEIAAAAGFIASKYNDIYATDTVTMAEMVKCPKITSETIVKQEMRILKTIDYTISYPTPIVFLHRCLSIAKKEPEINDIRALSSYLLELSLYDISSREYTSHLLGTSAFAVAYNVCLGCVHITWPETFEYYTQTPLHELLYCMKQLLFYVSRYHDDDLFCSATAHYSKKNGVAIKFHDGLNELTTKINKYI